MKKQYINSIVYNQREDGKKIYYVVKAFDGQILQIEQTQTQSKEDIKEAINLQELRHNERLSILYYAYGRFDRQQGGKCKQTKNNQMEINI